MFSYKKTRMQKLTKGYLAKRSSFLERKGDRRTSGDSWFLYVWIWESRRMLHMPPLIYKKFPLPDSNLNSHHSNLSFLVESRIHYVNQKEWRVMLLLNFYQRGYTQNPSLAILKELHRPALLTLRRWLENPERILADLRAKARTDHERQLIFIC